MVNVGNALPVVALGASAVFAFDTSRPQLSDAGVAALEAGGIALVAAHRAQLAAVTPYAKEFDMPWPYAVAAVTNVARTWSTRRGRSRGRRGASRAAANAPHIAIGPGSVNLVRDIK